MVLVGKYLVISLRPKIHSGYTYRENLVHSARAPNRNRINSPHLFTMQQRQQQRSLDNVKFFRD